MENFNATQSPDPRPGNYYVTARKGEFYVLLRGPFLAHSSALAAVRETMQKACDLDPRGHWYEYGTARMNDYQPDKGKLNAYFDDCECATK